MLNLKNLIVKRLSWVA